MKKFTKLLGIVLIIALVMSMGTMALAEDVAQTGLKITISSDVTGHTYRAYRIFKGDIESNTVEAATKLSNIQWGDGVVSANVIKDLYDVDNIKSAINAKLTADGKENTLANAQTLTAAEIAECLSGISDAADLRAMAKAFSDNKGTATATDSTATTGGYEISNLAAGYYLVVDTSSTATSDDAYSALIVNLVGNTSVTAKVAKPTSDKKVQDETADAESAADSDGFGETADHEINESFQFKLIATLPADADYAAYDAYKLVFTDTPSTGITYEEMVSVTIAGKTSANAEVSTTVSAYKADGTDAEKVGYKLENGLTDNKGDGSKTLTITIDDLKKTSSTLDLTKGATVTVIFKAHLNESAYVTPVGGTGTTNNNKFKLSYSNNPTSTGTGDTTEDTVWVFTYEVDNTKWAGPGDKVTDTSTEIVVTADSTADPAVEAQTLAQFATANPSATSVVADTGKYYVKNGSDWYKLSALPNAGFTLYSDSAKTTAIKLIDNGDGTYTVADQTATAGVVTEMTSATSTGIFNVKGLDAGTYYLAETKTPAGYNTAADTMITISATHSEDASGVATVNLSSSSNMDNEIVDNSGTVLPSTGGVGTTIFYVVGSIMVVAAGVLLITKKRMNREG